MAGVSQKAGLGAADARETPRLLLAFSVTHQDSELHMLAASAQQSGILKLTGLESPEVTAHFLQLYDWAIQRKGVPIFSQNYLLG